ncbi:hypothetical protein C8J57DRAFT_1244617 [Mycena rebaudengoi]|nr:hypothetical protein C8J57DRAFT_1244617 [Mycena rebaudengoi]
MPSFNTMISALAAVAFASLSFAAPVDVGGVAVSVPIDLNGDGVLGTFVPVVGHSHVDVAADIGAVSVSARASAPPPRNPHEPRRQSQARHGQVIAPCERGQSNPISCLQ